MGRKTGQKMTPAERAKLSIEESFNHISQFNRRDVGGRNLQTAFAKVFKAIARTKNVPITERIATLVGQFAWEIAGEQRDGTANRQAGPIEDMFRRLKLIREADQNLKSGRPWSKLRGLQLLDEAIRSDAVRSVSSQLTNLLSGSGKYQLQETRQLQRKTTDRVAAKVKRKRRRR